MDGRRAVTRVDGVSGAASKNHVQASALQHASVYSCAFRVFGALRRHRWLFLVSLLACQPADCQLQIYAQRTTPQGLQASVAAKPLRRRAEREACVGPASLGSVRAAQRGCQGGRRASPARPAPGASAP